MKIFRKIREFRAYISGLEGYNESSGFVPTMGYLHDGHISLVKKSIEENKYTVVSIFVNPIQFGEDEDLEKYPRDLNRDRKILDDLGIDILLAPETEEIYKNDRYTTVHVEKLTEIMCGASRPGHFDGVTTIVSKLFNIVRPKRSYFGMKDAQQLIVIKKMVEELNFDIEIKAMPIIREPDGLALSSRNVYLSKSDRETAANLNRVLDKAKKKITLFGETNPEKISKFIAENLKRSDINRIDYIEIRNLDNLIEPGKIDINNCIVAVAIYLKDVRLIDNFILGEI